MAITLTLGTFTFQDMEIPENIPFPRGQKLSVKTMIGGVRQIDAMGLDLKSVKWSGTFFPTAGGQSALDRARALSALCDAGQPLDLMWDEIFLSVYIEEFTPDYRFGRIPYSISLEVLQDLTAPLSTTNKSNADDLIGNDLASANSLTSAINNPTLTGLMSSVSSAVYSASSAIASAQGIVGSTVGSLGSTLVGASLGNVTSILQPVLAASAQVSVLSGQQDSIISSALGPGGVVAGASIASNLASFSSISSAMTQQTNLLQLGSLLGRMATNLTQINSSARIVTVSGGSIYDVAAREYGDPTAANLIMQANKVLDPSISGNTTLIIPPYVASAVNGGILG